MRRMYWGLIALAAAVGMLLCGMPSVARAEITAAWTSVYGFDPYLGKQRELSAFTWPDQKAVSVAARFRTDGYASRKTVELFFSLTNRKGELVEKQSRSLSLAVGEHEYVLPELVDMERLFASDRFYLEAEVKVEGGPRISKKIELVVNGPNAPRMVIGDLKMVDPKSRKALTGVQPGQAFLVLGTVSVADNSTALLPQLCAWGVMNGDTLKTDPWTRDQFSDTFWDTTSLNARNGKWRFEIGGRAPQFFDEGKSGSQPFTILLAVELTPQARVTQKLGGTVNPGKGAFAVSKDLQERLVRLERNWHWTVQTMK